MDPLTQSIIAALVVTSAGVYLAYRAFLAATARQSRGCGTGCSTCPSSGSKSAASKPPVQLITIEPPKADRNR